MFVCNFVTLMCSFVLFVDPFVPLVVVGYARPV